MFNRQPRLTISAAGKDEEGDDMAADLGASEREVHASPVASAREVIDFWFALTTEQQFAKDDKLDAKIAKRFESLCAHLLATDADGWRGDAERMLAAIIVLDQFSRNLNRGSADAYAADPLAVQLTLEGIRAGCDLEVTPDKRAFFYMPLMHAENMGLQNYAIALFSEAGLDMQVKFARDHAAVIAEFGRFPSRNKVLGRKSNAAEKKYLSRPDAGW